MPGSPASDRWAFEEAEYHFGELVRRARQEGPQHVLVQGRDEVVVLSAEEFGRLRGERAVPARAGAMPDGSSSDAEAARQAALLRGAPEEAEALRFVEGAASWPDR